MSKSAEPGITTASARSRGFGRNESVGDWDRDNDEWKIGAFTGVPEDSARGGGQMPSSKSNGAGTKTRLILAQRTFQV